MKLKRSKVWKAVVLALLTQPPISISRVLARDASEGPPAQQARPYAGTFSVTSSPKPTEPSAVPFDVDAAVPAVDPSVSCSRTEVLQGVTQRVKELLANLNRISAKERIEYRELDKKGRWLPPTKVAFKYVADVHNLPSGRIGVDESRIPIDSAVHFPNNLMATGTLALSVIFHPSQIGEHDLVCEGLGRWQGQPAWQLRFEEQVRPLVHDLGFVENGNWFMARLKGRAWFALDTFQLLHLETDLQQPLSAIRLERLHNSITYGAVEFPKRNLELWLPESAEVFLDYRAHRYLLRHAYDGFKLFSVDTSQTIHDPR